jgi:single-stranded-DNA-specific exonuclease
VLRLDGEFARGSARSIPEFDLMTALDASSGHLLRHGGHARAAGFTVARDQLAALQAELSRLAASLLGHLDLRPHLNLVTEVGPHQLSGRLLQELSRLEPHGEANPRPLLCVRGAAVSGARVVGTGHLRLELDDTPQGTMDAIAFGRGGSLSQVTRRMDLAATLRTNTWGGCSRLELRVEDLAPA